MAMPQLYSECQILLALQALRNNPKLGLRGAARLYQVNYWALRRRQNGVQSRRDWIPKSRKLSDLEEQIIVKFILDLDSRGFPPRLRGVEEMANRLLADRDASPVGKRWAMNFVKRHKELKTRFFVSTTTREPNAKIRLLFASGSGSWRSQSASTASDRMTSGTLTRPAS
ncbi:Uncharacterized protein HZ326_6045 [Fusarium oxysporum f. sp. albedinis]|nr:Uncharacterized protein HZ326_6045 [Fusarium oxysporum f. sp. albedinis]